MKEIPILFSGPMVKAIMEGRKTQTRRVVKTDGLDECGPCGNTLTGDVMFAARDWVGNHVLRKCHYGKPGDRLWVRETFAPCAGGIVYRADGGTACPDGGKWRPSIFMPRWASRITLEITGVRVERLNEISDFDAFQEGVKDEPGTITGPYCRSFVQGFKNIWESINGPGSWDENPWVWVIEFRRVNQ